ncbi:glycosyltransferase [Paralimibaculum aggregatum]|uniref:Glycosyltransferase n=1 Tax=Paralimibaculum aggregatum TaxID=3036245 RepID=A0ABQ6LIC5_9RHOB|nr:glycosyltransferase [Limibaculum sp. NKW23]GMG83026.1 glycosyltransferase [Limibaculum sp. NKW23]
MRIAAITLGTRGDVQPILALAKGLAARGHEVTLWAPEGFGPWIGRHGIAARTIEADIRGLMADPEIARILRGQWWALRHVWRSRVLPMVRASLEAVADAAEGADLILHHPKIVGAEDVAEAMGLRRVLASPVPLAPTGDFPVIVSGQRYGRVLNRLSWRLTGLARLPYMGEINRWRRERLGLGPGHRCPRPAPLELCAVSPAVLPRPADWPERVRLTGYWRLAEGEGWAPDPGLARFLAAGPAPVYVGFGSMSATEAGPLTAVVVEAVRRAGLRAVLATGWGGLSAEAAAGAPEAVHVIEGAPHDALFPLMAAAVHHGGAGTTAAALHAGRPMLICPAGVDQPFWGARIAALGCGPAPLPLKRLAPGPLAERLRALTGRPAYAEAAGRIAETLSMEDGIVSAARAIEAFAAT